MRDSLFRVMKLALSRKALIGFLIIIVLLLLPGSSREFPWHNLVPATIVRVVDGDTFVAEIRDNETRVRLIGVDTPETVKPGTAVQPYGQEASAFTKSVFYVGRTVYLEYDVQTTDYYGRDLCYVWLNAQTLFNDLLVREGFAVAKVYKPNVKYAERFAASEALAASQNIGLHDDAA